MTPEVALGYWDIKHEGKILREESGIFNETYKFKRGQDLFVLQKLHRLISHGGPTKNYIKVTNFLRGKHYPAQIVLPSRRGSFLVRDGERSWRLLKAVPGKVFTHALNSQMVFEAGKCLGKTHLILKGFKKPLEPALPMFRYNEVLRKLRSHKSKLLSNRNKKTRGAAEFLLDYFPKYFLPKGLPNHLIHTDPKISNFLFGGSGQAPAMIDFDTVQRLSPLYDLGDALRSLCGREEDDRENRFDMKNYRAFLRGYRKAAVGYFGQHESRLINQATALVILGLATSFLNDCVDDSYFGWDHRRYANRKSHNLARALGQIALYKSFATKIFL